MKLFQFEIKNPVFIAAHDIREALDFYLDELGYETVSVRELSEEDMMNLKFCDGQTFLESLQNTKEPSLFC